MTTTNTTANTLALPEFTMDKATLIQMRLDAGASNDGATLFTGIAAMRANEVAYLPNKSGEGFGWKGVNKAAASYELSNSEMSKITKIVQTHLQAALECEESEVKDHVLVFINEHGSVHSAYDKINAASKPAPTPREWSLAESLDRLVRKAASEGVTDRAELVAAFYESLDRCDVVYATAVSVAA